MDQRFIDVCVGQEENYLMPFLWQHGEKKETLPAQIEAVWNSGCRAFCVESRPHKDFCGDGWWQDMDIILSEAEKRGMKVWILDDQHFPTGYANGIIEKKYPHLRRRQLVEQHLDVQGPRREISMLIQQWGEDDEIVSAFACRRTEAQESCEGPYIDLSEHIHGRYLLWDIPEGTWRIFVCIQTLAGCNRFRQNYIHHIDADSAHALIEAVYEPHWQHYARYFGKTLVGFFSDEPGLGNDRVVHGGPDQGMYDQKLGQPGLALPWTKQVLSMMEEELRRNISCELSALWYPAGPDTPRIRLAYMNAVTQLWRQNFSMQLGQWCRDHGVMYIGHVIEDMNSHARLGRSGGHFFRSLDGQDMAGIDVVLQQIMPGLAHYQHVCCSGGGMADPEFFQYMLAKLAFSHAHLQPRMQGRAMCEVFGAYGWAESTVVMKQLMDHLLVRGIHYFVPHAFSPKFPDPDCPPHFHADGHNPQWEAFGHLMRYVNRMSHLLAHARPVLQAGILYHAEAEWSGEEYMLSQKPAKVLYDAHQDYAVIPIDALLEDACIRNGVLSVGNLSLPALIVPYAAWLPDAVTRRLEALVQEGLPVLFVEKRPQGISFGQCVSLQDLPDQLRNFVADDIEIQDDVPLLRVSHGTREGSHIWMLVNENGVQRIQSLVKLSAPGYYWEIDALSGRITQVDLTNGKYAVDLEAGQSVVLISCDDAQSCLPMMNSFWHQSSRLGKRRYLPVTTDWMYSQADCSELSQFSEPRKLNSLFNATGTEGDSSFSGLMRYTADIDVPFSDEVGWLDLGDVGSAAHVLLNGHDLGWTVCPPYRYEVMGKLISGKNRLQITVANTLVFRYPDPFSRCMPIEPSGLMGPVQWICSAEEA